MNTEPYLCIPGSGQMVDRSGRLLYAFLNDEEQWCFPRNLDEISPHLVQATIAVEDQRFFRHHGVDAAAVLRALWQNVRHRTIVSGASTLSMQVVKRAKGSKRTFLAKAVQALGAVRLDLRVEKSRILETYINSAPYGMNLVGCEAASLRYFEKPAQELTLAEAALLAGLPKSPNGLMPLEHPDRAQARRDYVLSRMFEEDFINRAEYDRARNAPLKVAWHAFPDLSPHLAMRYRPMIDEAERFRTTLDGRLQAAIERQVAEHVATFGGEITNAAAIVIDVTDASVLAHVGSVDFFDTPGGGQVDATRAPRSPGSALKPFTYALAMERNRLYPCEMLLDGPIDYGLYDPENFDRQYRGVVSADRALRESLNVPAIVVLERIGPAAIHGLFQRAGFTTVDQPPSHYGLGLTLGNCEVRLEELAAAYCMLANLGEYRALKFVADAIPGDSKSCLSRGVCQALFDMMEQPLPDESGSGLPVVNAPTRVCWKTGTSTGYHDAWAFVFNRQYVVGVWMGNNDNRPSDRLVGIEAAVPLAGTIFRSLPPKNSPDWPSPGDAMHEVEVCAESGVPASPWCRATRMALVPRGQYLHRVCDVHYPASPGENGGGIRERWPAGALRWDLAHVARRSGVLADPVAEPGERTPAFGIVSPSHRAQFVLTGAEHADRIPLRTSIDRTTTVHWYLDDRYVGKSLPERALYLDLKPGEHRLVCMAPDGRTNSVRFSVVRPPRDIRFGE
jgi:penicillin-binding protein 1C